MIETHRENMCVIHADRYSLLDHYPTRVWQALQTYQSQHQGSNHGE